MVMDSLQAWGDSLNDSRYQFVARTLQSTPILLARNTENARENVSLWLTYLPSLRVEDIDTLSEATLAGLAESRCTAVRAQAEAAGGSVECSGAEPRQFDDWRGVVTLQRVQVPSAQVNLRRADVVVPMHGALFTAIVAVRAGPGDVDRLEEIVATLKPPFTRSGVER
jgi:hypothetical protein